MRSDSGGDSGLLSLSFSHERTVASEQRQPDAWKWGSDWTVSEELISQRTGTHSFEDPEEIVDHLSREMIVNTWHTVLGHCVPLSELHPRAPPGPSQIH